ncbi:MAG: N-acetylmuramoyl-L-alanine amidase AmiD [Candidatus Erwinia impunctatus]|nr:N-acetylmuramoyl-L-alanine amidase AmiD [Culicoides impunctatus]
MWYGGYWQKMILSGVIMLLMGCTQYHYRHETGYRVDLRHQTDHAPSRIKVIVLHYTAETLPVSLALLRGDQVSAHYVIASSPEHDFQTGEPTVIGIVPEDQVAWHAGTSFWRGATRLNDTSLGIELVNQGPFIHDGTQHWAAYPPAQIAALLPLLKQLIARYQIAPENIVAHSDIAPQRKQDPGPAFPWQWLAAQGVGAWPNAELVQQHLAGRAAASPVVESTLLSLLARYGYAVTPEMSANERRNVIRAFQMHFRPANYSGIADAESEAIVCALLQQQNRQQ